MKAKNLYVFIFLFFLSFLLFINNDIHASTDVTSFVQINKSSMYFDRRTGQTSFNVSLTNISAQAIQSPFFVVVKDIIPGMVSVANSDSCLGTPDTCFDYSSLIADDVLEPGETSMTKNWAFNNPRRLRFSFTEIVHGTLSGANQPPVADPNGPYNIVLGEGVILDGSGSFDPNDSIVSFEWDINNDTVFGDVTGPTPALTSTDLASFGINALGSYPIELRVTDTFGATDSDTTTIIVGAPNIPPVADANGPYNIAFGDGVNLDGSGSFDPNDSIVSFEWDINNDTVFGDVTGPTPALTSADLASFGINAMGSFPITLEVIDTFGSTDTDTTAIIVGTPPNTPPVADAGRDRNSLIGSPLYLDGSNSFDPDFDPITFQWSLTSSPGGSSPTLFGMDTASPRITTDIAGDFTLELIVDDGTDNSSPDDVIIHSSLSNVGPNADAGMDQFALTNSPVFLDGTGSFDPDNGPGSLTHSWTFTSTPSGSSHTGSGFTGASPSFIPDLDGTFVLDLDVNDGALSDNDQVSIFAGPSNQAPNANAGPDQAFILNGPVTLDGSGSFDPEGSSITHLWNLSSVPPASTLTDLDITGANTAAPFFTPDAAGTFVVDLLVSDGSLSDMDTVLVRSSLFRAVASANPSQGSVPLDVDFTAFGEYTYGNIVRYRWDFQGDGTFDTSDSSPVPYNINFPMAGSFDAVLEVMNDEGDVTTDTVTINALSGPSVNGSATPDIGSPPLNVNFSAVASDPDGTIVLYEWDFEGDGTFDFSSTTTGNTSHTYTSPGLFNAEVRVTDNDGATATDTVPINVGAPPTASASADVLNGIVPLAVNFTGSGTDDGTIVLYEWDFEGDGMFDFSSVSTGNTSHTYLNSGVFNATLRVTDNDGLFDTDAVLITVEGPPISLPRAFPTSGAPPLTVTFFASGDDLDGGPEFFDWDYDGDGTFDRHLIASMNSEHTYTSEGVYDAKLQVTDNDGLTASAIVQITVTDPNPLGLPTAEANASPTNGGAPLKVNFDGNGTDPNGSIVLYEWDFEGDGTFDFSEAAQPSGVLGILIDNGSFNTPFFVDIDNDGDKDLFAGNSNGNIFYYRNDGDNTTPLWVEVGQVENSGAVVIDVGSYANPVIKDIDNDGDFDMYAGNSNGVLFYFQNDGNNTAPVWTDMGMVQNSTAANIDVGSYSAPAWVDVDNDGDFDMYVGNSGGNIRYFQNDGNITAPVWTDMGLIQNSTASNIDIGSYASPEFVDIDNDGDFDMYVGNSSGFLFFFRNDGNNTAPVWTDTGQVQNSAGSNIDVGSYNSPAFVDIDNDGDFDMFNGNSGGQMYFYRNTGNNTSPVWLQASTKYADISVANYASPAFVDIDNNGEPDLYSGDSSGFISRLKTDGEVSRVNSTLTDVGAYASPALVDIDNDGDFDKLVGNQDGWIRFFQNDGNNTVPVWTNTGLIQDSTANTIDIGSYSSPAFVDLDNDGDFDMYVGNSGGNIRYFQNDGNNTAPVWTDLGLIQNSTASNIDIGSYASPEFVDIDNDGDFDMYVGNSGGTITYFQNDGNNTAPVWTDMGLVQNSAAANIDVGSYSNPDFTDLDNDGDFDMYAGNSSGNIRFYQNDGNNTAPVWTDMGLVQNSAAANIDVGSYAAPAFEDIDNDGDFDMHVGEVAGVIRYFQNTGSNTAPVWTDMGLSADSVGSQIDVGSYSSPDFADIDNDGDFDMYVGEISGRFLFLRNDGNNTAPVWIDRGFINSSGGGTLDIGSYSSPEFADIDNDGDLDMYVGESGGRIVFVRNDGNNTAPMWVNAGFVTNATGSTIDVGNYATPALVDIDSDGDFDLLMGENLGTIFYYRNDGTITAPVWNFVTASYQEIDAGSRSNPEFLDADNDADLDLFVGNSLGIIQRFPNLGFVMHTFTVPGMYNSVFRITDNDGLTDTDTVAINVLAAGSPSAIASALATIGDAPFTVSFIGSGTDSDGTVVLYEWDFNDDGAFDFSSAASGNTTFTYTAAGMTDATLRVTDNDGKTATDTLTIDVRLNVTVTRDDIFNPNAGESGTIDSTLSADTIVTIRIIDTPGNTVRTLVNSAPRAAGSYSDSWDGKDDAGNIVRDGVYYFLIDYEVNGQITTIDFREDAVFSEITPSRSWPSRFNPFKDEVMPSTFAISKASEVSMYVWRRDNSRPVSTIAPVRTLFTRALRGAGTHTEIWDGVDDNGIVSPPWYQGVGYPITLWTYVLPDSAIIITGNTPEISNISADPNFLYPAFSPYGSQTNQFTTISFDLSKSANLEAKVVSFEGIIVKTIMRNNLPAGTNTTVWDGKDLAGNLVKEGSYAIGLTAIDNIGNRSLLLYSVVFVSY